MDISLFGNDWWDESVKILPEKQPKVDQL